MAALEPTDPKGLAVSLLSPVATSNMTLLAAGDSNETVSPFRSVGSNAATVYASSIRALLYCVLLNTIRIYPAFRYSRANVCLCRKTHQARNPEEVGGGFGEHRQCDQGVASPRRPAVQPAWQKLLSSRSWRGRTGSIMRWPSR